MNLPTELPLCQLRPWCNADVDQLAALANDRMIWRNLTHLFPHPYSEQDARDWVAIANREDPPLHVAITLGSDIVGGIGIEVGTGIHALTADVGYWVARDYWGRGIATAALRAWSQHLLSTTRLERLQAAVFAWNPASARVLERGGYTQEAVCRNSVFKDGEVIDSLLYARTRSSPGVLPPTDDRSAR